jgi:hypothetical protein
MKVFGLQGDVYRLARLGERQAPEAALARFELVRPFDLLRAEGLTVDAASAVLGLARARLAPRSRRPHRTRRSTWPSALVEAVQRLREDFPMWGRAKLAVLLRAEDFVVSESTVGQLGGPRRGSAGARPAPRQRQAQAPATAARPAPAQGPCCRVPGQLNGAVERANGSWRYEFYAVYDLPETLAELNPLIDSF